MTDWYRQPGKPVKLDYLTVSKQAPGLETRIEFELCHTSPYGYDFSRTYDRFEVALDHAKYRVEEGCTSVKIRTIMSLRDEGREMIV